MSGEAAETALLAAMEGLAPPGIRLGCRAIRDGDETLLLPQEAAAFPGSRPAARRASGAARAVARRLLGLEGLEAAPIGRSAAGAPLWPPGVAGSLAHDEAMAVAAVTRAAFSPGIDVEPAVPLPADVASLVAIAGDNLAGVDARLAGRVLFSAKEAVYKAVYPLDGEILGYEHIRVDLASGEAVTANGRRAWLRFCLLPRIVVLAVTH